jgi:hypothetical protein
LLRISLQATNKYVFSLDALLLARFYLLAALGGHEQ